MNEEDPPVHRGNTGSSAPRRPPVRHGYAISKVDGSPIYFRQSAPGGSRESAPDGSREAAPDGSREAAPAADAASAPLSVALCDGIGCDGFVWKYLWRDLVPRHHVIHWHYRGHGRTPMPRDPDRVTIADLADDLASVLDECEVDRAALIGHSMGVQVSLETYRRHRDRVQALILVCGAPGNPLETFRHSSRLVDLVPRVRAVVAHAPWLFNLLSRAVLPTRASYALAALLEVNADLLEQSDFMPYLRGISRVDIELFLDMLSAANEHSARDLLGEIDVPVLVVAGSHDGFTPPSASLEMHQAITGAELLLVENGSHTAPLERPEEVDSAVLAFLDRCA